MEIRCSPRGRQGNQGESSSNPMTFLTSPDPHERLPKHRVVSIVERQLNAFVLRQSPGQHLGFPGNYDAVTPVPLDSRQSLPTEGLGTVTGSLHRQDFETFRRNGSLTRGHLDAGPLQAFEPAELDLLLERLPPVIDEEQWRARTALS